MACVHVKFTYCMPLILRYVRTMVDVYILHAFDLEVCTEP